LNAIFAWRAVWLGWPCVRAVVGVRAAQYLGAACAAGGAGVADQGTVRVRLGGDSPPRIRFKDQAGFSQTWNPKPPNSWSWRDSVSAGTAASAAGPRPPSHSALAPHPIRGSA